MKKRTRILAVILVLAAFFAMAAGSISDTSTGDGDGKTTDREPETIEEQVLLDRGGLKVTALEYVEDAIWGDGIKVLIENDTDKDLGIGCNALIVNNYMLTDLFNSSVAAGKKANATIWLSSAEMEAAGIENVGLVEVYFHVYNDESLETVFDADAAAIKTSEFYRMDTDIDDAGQELFNRDGIRIAGKVVDENSFWGRAVLLCIENKSGKNVTVSCEDMSVNGFLSTLRFTSTIYNKKTALGEIAILSGDLKKNGIASVDDIGLSFHIYDADSHESIVDTEAISFSAK